MATSNPTMPRPNMPELGYGSWPNATAPRVGFGSLPNLNAPPPYFDPGPVVAAPVPQPLVKPARRTRTMVAWSLWMLATGLAAGPLLAEHVDRGLEAGIEWLANAAPSFLRPYLPKPLERSTPQPQALSVAPVSAPEPAIAPIRTAAEQPEPTREVATPPVEAQAPVATKTVQPERRVERAQTRKTRATSRQPVVLAKAASAVRSPKHARRPRGEAIDPFAPAATRANKAAASASPTKAAPEPAVRKSRPTKSGDSLDELMAGAASASPSKDRRNSSKTIDAMLLDVQKSQPAPRPARAERETLPSLTASDIAKAMAGVKTGVKACGPRFGESGAADLRLTVGKNGKVSDVAVRGRLAGSPISDCITRVVQRASFPPNSGLKFNYRVDVQ